MVPDPKNDVCDFLRSFRCVLIGPKTYLKAFFPNIQQLMRETDLYRHAMPFLSNASWRLELQCFRLVLAFGHRIPERSWVVV